MSNKGRFNVVPLHTPTAGRAFGYVSKGGNDANNGTTPALAKATPAFNYNIDILMGQGIYTASNIQMYSRVLYGIGEAIFDGTLLPENGSIFPSDVQSTQGHIYDMIFQNCNGTKNLGLLWNNLTYTRCTFKNVRMYSASSYLKSLSNCVIIDGLIHGESLNLYYTPSGTNNSYYNTEIVFATAGFVHANYTEAFKLTNCYFDKNCKLVLPDSWFTSNVSQIQFAIQNSSINCPIYSYNGGNWIKKFDSIFAYIESLVSYGYSASRFTNVNVFETNENPDKTLPAGSPLIGAGVAGSDIGGAAQGKYFGTLFPTTGYVYKNNVTFPNNKVKFDSSNLGYILDNVTDGSFATAIRDDLEIKQLPKLNITVDGTTASSRCTANKTSFAHVADFILQFADNNLTGIIFQFTFDDGDLTIGGNLKNDSYVFTQRVVNLTAGIDFVIGATLQDSITNINTVINATAGISSVVITSRIHITVDLKAPYTVGTASVIDPATILLNLVETSANASITLFNNLGSNPSLDTYEARYSELSFLASASEASMPFIPFLKLYQPKICRRGTGANEKIFGNGDKYGYYNELIGETINYRYAQERYTLTSVNVES